MGCQWVDEPSGTTRGGPHGGASHQAASGSLSRDYKYVVGLQHAIVTHVKNVNVWMSCIFQARVRLESDLRIHLVCFDS